MNNYSTNSSDSIFLTSAEAARLLNVSLSTMKKFIYQGRIKTLKTPGGHYRIYRDDLFKISKNSVSKKSPPKINGSYLSEIAEVMMGILDDRLKFCKGHAVCVSKFSFIIGQGLKLTQPELQRLKLAAYLHDIGKLRIDQNILNKPSTLTVEEYSAVKTHALIGSELLNSIRPFSHLSHIVRQHHERFDGKGYPDGLKGEDICLEARIISLAEAFASMTALDCYKKPLDKKDAFEEIKINRGRQFDPEVTDVLFKAYAE